MELKAFSRKAINFVSKYRYVLAVIVLGFLLVAIPGKTQIAKDQPVLQEQPTQQEPDIEESLSQLLNKIDGAGEVSVFLSIQTGEEYIYQTNQATNSGENSINSQTDTVTITDAERNQMGLIKKTLAPTYRGAVVICEGADNPTVRLSIVEAVSNATGISTDRISVLKMK